jgi:2-dehydro-3-deoxygluconokinase
VSELITFGESMLRLSSGHNRLEDSNSLDLHAGGAEYNVAVNCSRLGFKTAWVSRLVDNWTGKYIQNKCREHGVNTEHVIWSKFDGVGNERNGFYHLENGVGPRAAAVTYDRGHTAISNISKNEVNWKKAFERAKWFHVSGITPALSDSAAAVTLEALQIAAASDITTSFDLNFRSKLWSTEKAQEVIKTFMPYIKVLIGNEEDFEKCLGIKVEGATDDYSALDPESYKAVVRKAVETYPNVTHVGTTLRVAKTGLLNDWRTLLFDGNEFCFSRIYKDLELVDRVGGGDSFSSGLIASLMEGRNSQESIEFAGAYSALAHTFPGDINWTTREEAERAMKGGAARIQR